MNIIDKFVIQLYVDLTGLAHERNQTVGEKNDYYVTLEQVERALMNLQEDKSFL